MGRGSVAYPVSSCAGLAFSALIDINDISPRMSTANYRGTLLLIFAPIVAVLAGAALLLVAAAAYPERRGSLITAAEIAPALAGLVAMLTLYRQIRVRQASQRGLQRAEEHAGHAALRTGDIGLIHDRE